MMGLLLALAGAVQSNPARAARVDPVAAVKLPALILEAPEELESVERDIEAFDRERLRVAMSLAGLQDPGPPIRVVLAREDSPEARRMPSWVAGYAAGSQGVVVLFPARGPSYPDRSLEAVLHHEVAHVLIARAAGHRAVPRWFNEGLAMAAARPWDFQDQTRFALQALSRDPVSLRDLESLFDGDEAQVRRAYAISGAFVGDLVDRFGSGAPGEILHRLAADRSFRLAFAEATGSTLTAAEAVFWRERTGWKRWLPFLTSSVALWMAVTLLALLAIVRRRFRDAELRRQWDEEELEEVLARDGRGEDIN